MWNKGNAVEMILTYPTQATAPTFGLHFINVSEQEILQANVVNAVLIVIWQMQITLNDNPLVRVTDTPERVCLLLAFLIVGNGECR